MERLGYRTPAASLRYQGQVGGPTVEIAESLAALPSRFPRTTGEVGYSTHTCVRDQCGVRGENPPTLAVSVPADQKVICTGQSRFQCSAESGWAIHWLSEFARQALRLTGSLALSAAVKSPPWPGFSRRLLMVVLHLDDSRRRRFLMCRSRLQTTRVSRAI